MRKIVVILLYCSTSVCLTQNKISKVIVDKDTKKPLKGATINNSTDYAITNDDGKFVFYSKKDSISIRMLGYNKLQTSFRVLGRLGDTIFLKQKPIILNEIIIKDYKKLIYRVYSNVEKNYPHFTYIDEFFLRCILKRNDSIMKIEDISGRVKRNSMFTSKKIPKLKFQFQLLNQRKLGLLNKNIWVEDVKLHTFKELFMWFSTVFINPNDFEYTEEKLADSTYTKVSFKPFKKYQNKNIGYYIINNKDNAIKAYYSKINPSFTNKIIFKKKLGFRYRTINSELAIKYDKNLKNNKYFISNASLKQTLEVFNKKNQRTLYNITYNLVVTAPFLESKNFTSNVSRNRYLFKLKVNFDKNFWQHQNQLPLTKELIKFINNVQTYKTKYKIISNFE